MRILLCLIFLSTFQCTYSQTAWTANSFKFSEDTISLVDMTGATAITIGGTAPQPKSSGLINFPSNFSFHFGLNTYNNFAVSSYGFITLGQDITSNTAEEQEQVIAPLRSEATWDASVKLVGSAPNRKFIIEWNGIMQPSGEATKFQLWLSERNGKIEFVYKSVLGFGFLTDIWQYKVFCKASILGQDASCALAIQSTNIQPVISYSIIPGNNNTIYPKTRFTFQPDSTKPTAPSALSFANVNAGCLSVRFTDNSSNESLFQLERSDDNGNFKREQKLFTSPPTGTGILNYDQANLQPFWNYTYRVFATNGFLNSDTVQGAVQTLMPQLNGIKKIPGDYPSITALLQDASCKHLGPDLVIELQNNYSINSETLPIAFGKKLQNRFIHSIIIRPATGANITWTASTTRAIFYVDSVKHVCLDGRPGGTGTSRNLTIEQLYVPSRLTIQYYNGADSGVVNYCRIISKSSQEVRQNYPIYISYKDSALAYRGQSVNSFTLSNCYLSADSGNVENFVYVSPADSTGGQNTRIINNEFTRCRHDAIYMENGCANSVISGNHFYQVDTLFPIGGNPPLDNASCVKLVNTEAVTVRDNYFGGSTPVWGQGKFPISLDAGETEYHFIHYQNTAKDKKVFLIGNKFGNIGFTSYEAAKMIYASGGTITIDSNVIGTTDSINSITCKTGFSGFELWGCKGYITNNFLSSIQCRNPDNDGTGPLTFVLVAGVGGDTTVIRNNDFGGTNDPNANSAEGRVDGIRALSARNLLAVSANQVRGLSSTKADLNGLSLGESITSVTFSVIADSNSIHHLKSRGRTLGISSQIMSSGVANRISGNTIYALYTTGQAGTGPSGSAQGINCRVDTYPDGHPTAGELQIFNNHVHSLSTQLVTSNSSLSATGIVGYAYRCFIWNNDVRLGVDTRGNNIDTLNTKVQGIVGSASYLAIIEHNSIFIGGRGITAQGIEGGNFVTNNIIQIDRVNIDPTHPHKYDDGLLSAHNLWYSSTDGNAGALLQARQQSCHCDSSSFAGDPKFINPNGDSAHYDLHVGAGSMADSSGTPSILNIVTDIDGLNRNTYSPVDIGSHAKTLCGTGVVPTITITSPVLDTILLCGNSGTISAAISNGNFNRLQWQKNLNDITNSTGTSLVVDSPGVYRLVGKNSCGQAASRIITVLNNTNNVQPTASISTANTTVCSGVPVTFNSVLSNQGTAPLYQWQVNGVNVGPNSRTYTASDLTNNAQVKLIVKNTTTCNPNSTATSNIITMTETPSVLPSIAINGTTHVTQGESSTISSTPANGGSNPSYQWQDSTSIHIWVNITGATSPGIVYTPANASKLRCRLTSNATCSNPSIVLSNVLTFTVDVATGINPVPAQDYGIRYFPNPVSNEIVIDHLKISDQWSSLEILSSDGKQKIVQKNISNQLSVNLKVNHLPAGLYMVLLTQKEGKAVSFKFIKL